jgi:hypothetical protein
MAREKIKRYHQPGEHFWEELEEYKMTEEEILEEKAIMVYRNTADLKNVKEYRINLLKKIKTGQYFVFSELPASEKDITKFLEDINMIKEHGLDIGKGDFEYGPKMPLPKREGKFRKLIIFKRK